MTEAKPARIQLSRRKGFNLQAASRALNGLEAVKVDRSPPDYWGNPFKVEECREAGFSGTDDEIAARCVAAFKAFLLTPHWRNNWNGKKAEDTRRRMLADLPSLRGKNLACWCKPGSPCHADVLLELANAPVCEEVKP